MENSFKDMSHSSKHIILRIRGYASVCKLWNQNVRNNNPQRLWQRQIASRSDVYLTVLLQHTFPFAMFRCSRLKAERENIHIAIQISTYIKISSIYILRGMFLCWIWCFRVQKGRPVILQVIFLFSIIRIVSFFF